VRQWLACAVACYVDLFSRQLYLSIFLLWHLFFFVLLTVRIASFALAGVCSRLRLRLLVNALALARAV